MRVRLGAALAVLLVAGVVLLRGPWTDGARLADLLPWGASGAPVAGGQADLAGRVALGPEESPATLRLACDPAGAGLSAMLSVPRFAERAPRFDFGGLERPGGSTAPLTAILVSGAGGVRNVRVPASGAVAADPATSFTFTVAGGRRGADPLRGIASAMAEAGARITWTQGSSRAGDAALVATFSVAEAEAASVKDALAGCLRP